MTRPRWRALIASLRFRLAAAGFIAIYLPVLILLTVAVVTDDTNITDTTVREDRVDGGGGDDQVEVIREVDEQESVVVDTVVNRNADRPPWVPATAVALAPLAAALAWWWAGRAVRPLNQIRSVADEIQGGDLDRRIGSATGPTEVASLAGSFDAMLDRLSDAAQVQRQLIEETSHELRTPLAVLQTNADVLLTHPEPTVEVLREGVERSQRTAERLTTIVDELLVDARGRARTIDRRPADLMALVGRAAEDLQLLAAERGIELTVSGPAELRCRVDESTMIRAVANLIDNALRHSPAGSRVEVTVAAEEASVSIAVVDQGPGVAPEDRERIFERFWRGTDAGAGPGAGLGLAIARHIALAHGGDVRVESPVADGRGSRFVLTVSRSRGTWR